MKVMTVGQFFCIPTRQHPGMEWLLAAAGVYRLRSKWPFYNGPVALGYFQG